MAAVNAHWTNLNEGRVYPLDDSASAIDDEGNRLPSPLLADASLRWPVTAGRYAFLSAISVTDKLVTLTFQVSEDPSAADNVRPLGVVSIPIRDIVPQRPVALLPQLSGAGGWVVLGSSLQPYRGRFASPAQSRLAARAARAYNPLPVTSARVAGSATGLTGLVNLSSQSPLDIRTEERDIDGVLRRCIVIRLAQTVSQDGVPATEPGLDQGDLLRLFAGPCGGRPESRSCPDPQPIEAINAVEPDCDGRITLRFTGCAVAARLTDAGGVILDCGVGAAEACPPLRIPNSDGLLPHETDSLHIPGYPLPGQSTSDSVSDSFSADAGMPFRDCFDTEESVSLTVRQGLWAWEADDAASAPCGVLASLSVSGAPSGAYSTATAGMPSIATWDPGEIAIFRQAETAVKMTEGPVGAKHNAALIFNYREDATTPGLFVYHRISMDYDTQKVKIEKFNGIAFSTLVSVNVPAIVLDKWYRLSIELLPGDTPGRTAISGRVWSVEDNTVDVSIQTETNQYQPSTGRFGIGADLAITKFGYLVIDEAT